MKHFFVDRLVLKDIRNPFILLSECGEREVMIENDVDEVGSY